MEESDTPVEQDQAMVSSFLVYNNSVQGILTKSWELGAFSVPRGKGFHQSCVPSEEDEALG